MARNKHIRAVKIKKPLSFLPDDKTDNNTYDNCFNLIHKFSIDLKFNTYYYTVYNI